MKSFGQAATLGVSIISAIAAGASILWSFWKESEKRNKSISGMRRAKCSTNNPQQEVNFQGNQNPASQPDFGYNGTLHQQAEPPQGGYSTLVDALRHSSGMFSKLCRVVQALMNLIECSGRIMRDDDYQYQSFYSNSPWGQYGPNPNFGPVPGEYHQNGKCAFRRLSPFAVEAVPIGTPQSTPYLF